MSDPRDTAARLQCRDEVLQVLFWLEGEGFAAEMTPPGVARFLARPEDDIVPVLEDAVAAGLVERLADGRYTLSRSGRQEGGRRFLEEFADMRARDTHSGACTDPDCDCHATEAAACISERHGGHRLEDRDRR